MSFAARGKLPRTSLTFIGDAEVGGGVNVVVILEGSDRDTSNLCEDLDHSSIMGGVNAAVPPLIPGNDLSEGFVVN
jgi:hypothetical protein